jgi:hypothetical protein
LASIALRWSERRLNFLCVFAWRMRSYQFTQSS